MESRPLSSSPALWRLPFGHFSARDTDNAHLRQKILTRANNTCNDCGLRLNKHMEVRHEDDDHENNAESNLVCVCPFCHLRDHLGPTGFASAGIVIGAPSLTQGQINTLALSVWYIQSRTEAKIDIRAMPDSSDLSDDEQWLQKLRQTADSIWKDMEVKSVKWATVYSGLISEPDVLGGILNELGKTHPETYAERGTLLKGLHILPAREAFETQCTDWFAEFDATRPLSVWRKGEASFLTRIGSTEEDLFTELSKATRASIKRPAPSINLQETSTPNAEDNPSTTGRAPIGKRYAN